MLKNELEEPKKLQLSTLKLRCETNSYELVEY